MAITQLPPIEKKGRGRPKGSKNNDSTKVIKTLKQEKTFTEYIDEVSRLSADINYGNPKEYNGIELFNCTGHDVTINGVGTIKPHAYLRVSENSYIKGYIAGVPIYDVTYISGLLPEKSPNRILIVGQPICISAPHRDDLYMPHKVNHQTHSCVGIVQNPFYKDRCKRNG